MSIQSDHLHKLHGVGVVLLYVDTAVVIRVVLLGVVAVDVLVMVEGRMDVVDGTVVVVGTFVVVKVVVVSSVF